MTMIMWVIFLYIVILPAFALSLVIIVNKLSHIGDKNHSFPKKTLIIPVLIFVITLALIPPVVFKTTISNEGRKYIETGQTAYYFEADDDDTDSVNRIKLDGITYEDFYEKLYNTSFIFEQMTVEKTSKNINKPVANLEGTDIDFGEPTALEKFVSKFYGIHTNFDLIYSTKNENLNHCVFYMSNDDIELYCDRDYTDTLLDYYLYYGNYDFYLKYYSEDSPDGEEKISLNSDSNRLIWDTAIQSESINFNKDEQVRKAFPDAQVKKVSNSDENIDMDIIAESKDAVIGKYMTEIYTENDNAYQVLGHYNEESEDYDTQKVYVLPLPDDIKQIILAKFG